MRVLDNVRHREIADHESLISAANAIPMKTSFAMDETRVLRIQGALPWAAPNLGSTI
ncbi:hypothetical protein P775_15660 [Puniceibacterium antarcticum]|uniref:Uncharacterized protein n=1 Tax=Puniceibacterium antarcticum TaxID=1206336 RepID=A0A2G8RCF9_9RHOB|nr:hypothetical protein P775_15660 [Puniceibacterium antarcticum]